MAHFLNTLRAQAERAMAGSSFNQDHAEAEDRNREVYVGPEERRDG
jgi:hypothetical protein